MSTSAKDLRETLTAHCKHERHRTYAETLYWLSQYKDLARRAVQHSETVAAKLQEQTERAESAETELRKLREQKPVAWMREDGNLYLAWQKDLCLPEVRFSPLYAAPVHSPHKGATHCDDCGLTWLDDGLNPLRCPYCKDTVPAPAVPALVFMAHNKTSNLLFAAREEAERFSASCGPAAGVSVTECAVIGSKSAQQAPAAPDADAVRGVQ